MLRQTSNIAFPAADGSVFRQQGAPLLSFLSARTSAMPPSSVKILLLPRARSAQGVQQNGSPPLAPI